MAQPEDVAALLEGPKDRRAECAITSVMDKAVEIHSFRGGGTRSQSFRTLLARGIAADPALLVQAIEAARVSRERDATDQAQREE